MSRTATFFGIAILLAGAVSVGFSAETGDDKPNDSKIWSGVFTTAQTQRGKEDFEKFCSNCHNSNLSGTVRAPSLLGDRFMKNWQNSSLDVLFVKLRDSMPANYPETVPDETKIDILAFLLQQNGFPAGSQELKLDEKALEDIEIAQKGNQAATNFALVRMVGCLAQGPGNAWTLTKGTEPVVTKEEIPAPAALKAAADSPLGTETFELLSVAPFKPESRNGQRVEARGLLYRDASHHLITLTSLASAGPGCN